MKNIGVGFEGFVVFVVLESYVATMQIPVN